MNAGGVNILDNTQTALKVSNQGNQEALSRIFEIMFKNIQNSSFTENTNNDVEKELSANTAQTGIKINPFNNFILPAFNNILSNDNSKDIDKMEKWLSDIAQKANKDKSANMQSMQGINKIDEFIKSIFKVLSDDNSQALGTVLNSQGIQEKNDTDENSISSEITKGKAEILPTDNEQAVEDISKYTDIINYLSNVVAQIIQNNNFSNNEQKAQLNILPGYNVNNVELLKENAANTNSEISEKPIMLAHIPKIDPKFIEVFVNQVREKLQLKNPDKEIKTEDVLALIKEVDYKKVIDNLNIISSKFVTKSDSVAVANTEIKSDLSNTSGIMNATGNLPGIEADNIQKKDISNENILNLKSKKENVPEGNEDLKESFKHLLSKSESIGKDEIPIKNTDETKFIVKHENIIEAAVKGFKSLKLPEINELRVKLKPDELGEIVVKVVLEKGQVSGSIIAEKNEVVNILQNQVDNLKQELKSNNINVNSISVNIGNEQGSNHREFFNQNEKRERRDFENIYSDEMDEEQIEGFEIIA